MKEFFPILAASPLFSGVTEDELDAMLTCLAAKAEQFPKDMFLLHPGDTVEEIGMVLSGCALVVQEDIWGNATFSPAPHRGRPTPRPSPARQTVSPM